MKKNKGHICNSKIIKNLLILVLFINFTSFSNSFASSPYQISENFDGTNVYLNIGALATKEKVFEFNLGTVQRFSDRVSRAININYINSAHPIIHCNVDAIYKIGDHYDGFVGMTDTLTSCDLVQEVQNNIKDTDNIFNLGVRAGLRTHYKLTKKLSFFGQISRGTSEAMSLSTGLVYQFNPKLAVDCVLKGSAFVLDNGKNYVHYSVDSSDTLLGVHYNF